MALLWIVRILTLSKIVHCDIACNGVVLNVGIAGNSYWKESVYKRFWPGIDTVFEIEGKPIDLGYFEYRVGVPLNGWFSFWRWIKGGGAYTEDCLCTALLCLEAIGVPVPITITTPIELLRWLKHAGYRTIVTAGHTHPSKVP